MNKPTKVIWNNNMYLGHSKDGQFQVDHAGGALAFLVIS
jgi:hypothetical protein